MESQIKLVIAQDTYIYTDGVKPSHFCPAMEKVEEGPLVNVAKTHRQNIAFIFASHIVDRRSYACQSSDFPFFLQTVNFDTDLTGIYLAVHVIEPYKSYLESVHCPACCSESSDQNSQN